MSNNLINKAIKEISSKLNLIIMKKKEINNKNNLIEKSKILNEINLLINDVKEEFLIIDQELENAKGNIRLEFNGIIENNKMEYKKILKQIEKIQNELNNQILTPQLQFDIKDKRNYIANKMINNNQNLKYSSNTANEIIDRDKLTAIELKRQKEVLINTHNKIGEVEENLTLIQQIHDIMKNNNLFYRFKLYIIIILLFIANIIILFIKIR
jgi:hypothetical protein